MSRRVLVVLAVLVVTATAAGTWLARNGDNGTLHAGPTSTSTSTSAATSTSVRPVTTLATSTTSVPATSTAPPSTAPSTTTTAPPAPSTSSVPPLPGGDRSVYVLGDSVLLGTTQTLPAALAGWVVTLDTEGSRRLPQGIEVLRAKRSQIGAVVVIMLGNNYIASEGSFAVQIDEAMAVLEGVDRVVWVTVAERWPSRVEINQAIRAAPERWPAAVAADWAPMVAAHPEYAGDMLHLTASGRLALSNLIASTVGPA